MRQWLLVLVLVACGGKTDSDDLGSDQVVSGDDTGQSSGGDSGAPAGGPIEVTVIGTVSRWLRVRACCPGPLTDI